MEPRSTISIEEAAEFKEVTTYQVRSDIISRKLNTVRGSEIIIDDDLSEWVGFEMARIQLVLIKHGMKMAEPDDPIYREPAMISFIPGIGRNLPHRKEKSDTPEHGSEA